MTEKNKAFWDRFVFKHRVSRLSASRLIYYLTNGGGKGGYNYPITIPGRSAMDQPIDLPAYKVDLLVNTCFNHCSDRTILNIPKIVKAIIHIWGISTDEAMIKATYLLAGLTAANNLADHLNSKEYNVIITKIEILKGIVDNNLLEELTNEITVLLSNYVSSGALSIEQVNSFKVSANIILARKKSNLRIE